MTRLRTGLRRKKLSFKASSLFSQTKLGSPTAKAVLLYLSFLANDEGYCWPSVENIAANTEANKRTVRRVLQVFEAIGLVAKIGRGKKRVRGLQLNMDMPARDLRKEYTALHRQAHSGENSQCPSDTDGGVPATSKSAGGTIGGVLGTSPPHPLNGVTVNEPSIELPLPPLPPMGAQTGKVPRGMVSTEGEASLQRAVDQVMQGCCFTKRRLRKLVREQILQRSDAGGELPTIALAMIDAWKRFQAQGPRLRVRWSPANFFSEGHWRNSKGWHWDNEVLREERLQTEARVGSQR
jgi:hypothetical protein